MLRHCWRPPASADLRFLPDGYSDFQNHVFWMKQLINFKKFEILRNFGITFYLGGIVNFYLLIRFSVEIPRI
jgi:hypothetical protein